MKVNTIYHHNVLNTPWPIEDKSVQCCITSPPYYGLRDYGVDGQIGLEKTPEEYIENLVQVFREVRRVLKDDGTLFLNIGDSYFGGGASSVNSCGTSGKALEGYLMNGYFSENLCGECQQDYQNHKFHTDSLLFPKQVALLFCQIREYMEVKHGHLATSDFLSLTLILQSFFSTLDQKRFLTPAFSQLSSFLESRLSLFFEQLQSSCLQISNNVLTPLSFETLRHCVLEFAHKLHHDFSEKSYYNQDNALLYEVPEQNIQCISGYCSQCGIFSPYLKTYIQPQNYAKFSSIPRKLKPKDLIGIPWMLAFALRADGWYLRQDIIWHKPNPIPESVTDRCTKSHEYIFLMSKSQKYFYDYEAIKTEISDTTIKRLMQDTRWQNGSDRVPGKTNGNMKAVGTLRKGYEHRGTGDKKLGSHSGNYDADGNIIGGGMANKKSVWTVTTKPFKEAHFATFPEELIVDMIKAGSRVDDLILDPFMGAGTTALVARKLQRNYVGLEINPEYIKLANSRLHNELGMFV